MLMCELYILSCVFVSINKAFLLMHSINGKIYLGFDVHGVFTFLIIIMLVEYMLNDLCQTSQEKY